MVDFELRDRRDEMANEVGKAERDAALREVSDALFELRKALKKHRLPVPDVMGWRDPFEAYKGVARYMHLCDGVPMRIMENYSDVDLVGFVIKGEAVK